MVENLLLAQSYQREAGLVSTYLEIIGGEYTLFHLDPIRTGIGKVVQLAF